MIDLRNISKDKLLNQSVYLNSNSDLIISKLKPDLILTEDLNIFPKDIENIILGYLKVFKYSTKYSNQKYLILQNHNQIIPKLNFYLNKYSYIFIVDISKTNQDIHEFLFLL